MACDCIEKFHTAFAGMGRATRFDLPILCDNEGNMSASKVQIKCLLNSNKKRGERMMTVIPKFCPFCGVPYTPDPNDNGKPGATIC